jgi:uncharacterized repeat protein (TIGR01451 family)
MQKSSMWKLGALAAVVALGFFAVWQTQRGLQDDSPLEDGSATATSDSSSSAADPSGRVRVAQREPKTAPLNNPFADAPQNDPDAAPRVVHSDSPATQRGLGGFQADGGPGFERGTAGSTATPDSAIRSTSGAEKTVATPTADPFAPENVEDGFRSKSAAPAKTAGKTPAAKTGNDPPRNLFDDPGAGSVAGRQPAPKNTTATPAANPFNPSFKNDPPATAAKTAPAPKAESPDSARPAGPFGATPEADRSKTTPAGSDGPSLSGNTVEPDKPDTNAKKPGSTDQPSAVDNPFADGGAPKTESRSASKEPKPAAVTPAPKDNPFAATGDKRQESDPSQPAPKPQNPFDPSPKPAPKTNTTTGDTPPRSLYEPSPKKAGERGLPSAEPDKGTPFPDTDNKVAPVSPKIDKPEPKTQPEPKSPERSETPPRLMPVPPPTSAPKTPAREPSTPPVASPKADAVSTPAADATVTPGDAPQPAPQVSIHKTAPRSASLGKPFVYDILIKNVGGRTAHNVVVQDPIPSGVRLEGTDPQAFLSGNNLVWKIGSLATGESRKISVKVTPVRAGQIGSVATVNFVAQAAAEPAVARPKIVFQMQGPQQAKIGEKVTYRFTIANVGGADAKDVWLRDIIPDGLKHPAGDDIEYKIGTLPAGKTERISLAMTVARAGRMTNRAFISAAGGVRVEAKSAVSVSAPRLVISRTGPSRRVVGRPAVYQNMVTNGSTETVRNATLVESIPAGMEFVAASDGGRLDPARRTVSWSLGPLGPGKSKTVQLQLLPKLAGVQNSVVHAIGADGSTVRTASATKVVGYVSLGVDVPALDRPVNIGEQVTLRVIGRNRGTSAASNVKLKVALPAQLSLVSVRGPGKYRVSEGTITFDTIDTLAGKNRAIYDLTVKAVAQGDSRVKVQIQSDEVSKPLHREEAVLVLPASP